MTTVAEMLVAALTKDLSEEERERWNATANCFGEQLVKFTEDVGNVFDTIRNQVVQAAKRIESDDRRASLLQIYRQRHSWKKADLVRLHTYPLNPAARNRIAKLSASKSVGRGTTVAYHSIAERLVVGAAFISKMHDPATPPYERLRMLKQTKWWPEFVEMTYRGEYLRLKKLGGRALSVRAEQAVAGACCISVATLKQLCRAVRKDSAAGFTMSEPIEVVDFEEWKNSGQFPNQVNTPQLS